MTNAFWDFSLKVYSATGVADECLALQHKYDLNINLLLFVAYVGAKKRILSFDELCLCTELVRGWHEQVTKPLRHIRTTLKSMSLFPKLTPDQKEHLRNAIKVVELESERLEQDVLYQWLEMQTPSHMSENIEETIRTNIITLFSLNSSLKIQDLPNRTISAARAYSLGKPI